MLDPLTNLLRDVLGFFFRYTGNYGVAIILLTVAVKLVLLPLNISQMRAMRKMQEIAPRVKELQAKHKGDPQKLNQETMKLYREHGVNPVAGCLPLLLQFPILIALFQAFQDPRLGADVIPTFLGLNLSLPSAGQKALVMSLATGIGLPLGARYLVLPVLAGLTTYWQTIVSTPMSADPSQKVMLYVMPVMIGYFSLTFPAGLSLYWVVSNVLSIVQAYFTPKPAPAVAGGRAAK